MLHTTASIPGKAGTLLRSSGVRNLNGKKKPVKHAMGCSNSPSPSQSVPGADSNLSNVLQGLNTRCGFHSQLHHHLLLC